MKTLFIILLSLLVIICITIAIIYKAKESYKKTIKIAHIINPFKCDKDNPSYLYYAQPITFQSMYNAQQYAKQYNINVELYSINYPEDDEIVPEYFTKLPYLTRSTSSQYPELTTKKLPFVEDILQSLYKYSDADYLIFTNSDIGVQKHFYTEVYNMIQNEHLDSLIINRRDNIPKNVNGKRLTENDLDYIYSIKGEKHPGKDCFIFNRNLLNKVNIKDLFIGYPPWDSKFSDQLKEYSKKHKLYKNLYLTFHIGEDKSWQEKDIFWWFSKCKIWKQNIKNAGMKYIFT